MLKCSIFFFWTIFLFVGSAFAGKYFDLSNKDSILTTSPANPSQYRPLSCFEDGSGNWWCPHPEQVALHKNYNSVMKIENAEYVKKEIFIKKEAFLDEKNWLKNQCSSTPKDCIIKIKQDKNDLKKR